MSDPLVMKKIIYLADPEIIAIPIVECHESLINLKNQQELQYGLPAECELTAECYTKMRKTVFEKLCQAQNDLPHRWRFRLYEGFRSLKVQQMLFDEECQRVRERSPHLKSSEIFYEATRLVSPVINLNGTQNIPPHNTGGAVDVEIITADAQLVDMGMAAKDWCNVDPELCLTDCNIISVSARQNRILLLDVMQAHGFINYPTEWWHFSYGDRYWAYHQNASQAIYGSVEKIKYYD
jgi:D-alanyl-D-alanine dipeptidase